MKPRLKGLSNKRWPYSDAVEVVYTHHYVCSLCGYRPSQFDCIDKMIWHLYKEHGIHPQSWIWMHGYSDREIKDRFPHVDFYRWFCRNMWE